jgi:hypothetical protein
VRRAPPARGFDKDRREGNARATPGDGLFAVKRASPTLVKKQERHLLAPRPTGAYGHAGQRGCRGRWSRTASGWSGLTGASGSQASDRQGPRPKRRVAWPDVLRCLDRDQTRSLALSRFRDSGFNADSFGHSNKARLAMAEALAAAVPHRWHSNHRRLTKPRTVASGDWQRMQF